jgi:hypothetical protein
VWGVEMFRSGSDTANFSNSTDLLASVETRFQPGNTGTAWLALRTTAGSNSVIGYRLELQRHADGTTTAVAKYYGAEGETIYFDGAAPGVENGSSGWTNITIVTLRDHVYFFVNNVFIASGDGTLALGGTAALGIEPGTSVDFDTFLVRDTSPHDAQYHGYLM